jgi:hypothetical protein
MELLHYQASILGSQQHEMLLAANRVLAERCLSALLQCTRKETIGAIAALVGP